MRIDKGSPLEYNKDGAHKRIEILNDIHQINFDNAVDYGAGKGAYSLLISEKVKRVFSFDINRQFISEFIKHKPKNADILITSAELSSFKNNSFDSLFAIEVLEHLEDLSAGITELKRILKKDGYAYITVPNKYFPMETHHVYLFGKAIDGRYVPFLSMIDFVHKRIGSSRRFSVSSMCKYFNEHGFTTVGYNYIMPPFDNSTLGKKVLKPLTDIMEKTLLKAFSPNIAFVFRNSGK